MEHRGETGEREEQASGEPEGRREEKSDQWEPGLPAQEYGREARCIGVRQAHFT